LAYAAAILFVATNATGKIEIAGHAPWRNRGGESRDLHLFADIYVVLTVFL